MEAPGGASKEPSRPGPPPLREAPPPGVGPMVIEWSDKYNPRVGLGRVNVEALQDAAAKQYLLRAPLKSMILQYQWGDIDEITLAEALIAALFARDFYTDGFEHGKHWDRPGADAKEVFEDHSNSDEALLEALWPSDKGQAAEPKAEAPPEWRVFSSKCKSTWDWKDISAEASSKALVAFSADRTRIQIREYSHYCAG